MYNENVIHILFVILFCVNCSLGQYKARQKCEEYTRSSTFNINSTTFDATEFTERLQSEETEFPHMVALGYGTIKRHKFLCAGSLISENFVLTAAHCTTHSTLGPVTIARMGSTKPRTSGGQYHEIGQIIRHWAYSPSLRYNDIALLRLKHRVELSRIVRPACVNTAFDVSRRTTELMALSWGNVKYMVPLALELLKVDLRLYSHSRCDTVYELKLDRKLPDGIRDVTQICAINVGKDTSSCDGDSGGPLQITFEDGRQHFIVGVTSFGNACGLVQIPVVYSRVSAFIKWIEHFVWP